MRAVAHDLRTPLQPIMGYLNLILQDPQAFGVTGETKQILERCSKSVDRERQIINQMLDLSVLEGDKTDLEYSVFSVREMIEGIIANGGYALKADIAIDVPPDLTFEADHQKISHVIDVLLANGVSSSKPPKKIWITSYADSPALPFYRLSIRDNGIGITEAQLDEIFKPENDGSAGSRRPSVGDTGQLLAIAKKYIHLHGGYISVDSIVNIGSTFTIHIPKKRPDKGDRHDT
jgi:signal transduction histidine kinase